MRATRYGKGRNRLKASSSGSTLGSPSISWRWSSLNNSGQVSIVTNGISHYMMGKDVAAKLVGQRRLMDLCGNVAG